MAAKEEVCFFTFSLPTLIGRKDYPALFSKGFLIPCSLLHFYAHLKPHPISPGEFLFVLHLLDYVSSECAVPTYKQLAARMGVTDKMVRRYAKRLEDKTYLHRESRTGCPSQFDLTPLFDAIRVASQA